MTCEQCVAGETHLRAARRENLKLKLRLADQKAKIMELALILRRQGFPDLTAVNKIVDELLDK